MQGYLIQSRTPGHAAMTPTTTASAPASPAIAQPIDIESLVTEPIDTWSPLESDAIAFATHLTSRALGLLDMLPIRKAEVFDLMRPLSAADGAEQIPSTVVLDERGILVGKKMIAVADDKRPERRFVRISEGAVHLGGDVIGQARVWKSNRIGAGMAVQ